MEDSSEKEGSKGDDILRRMLKMSPDPHKPGESKAGSKEKPDGHPAKNNRPEDQ